MGAEPLLPQWKADADLGRVKSAEERNAFLRFGSRVPHWAAQHGAVTERMRAFQRVEGTVEIKRKIRYAQSSKE